MTHSVLPIRSPLQCSRVALLTLLALALGYVFVDKFWLSRRVEADHPTAAASTNVVDRSIAVLPFVDMSEKKEIKKVPFLSFHGDVETLLNGTSSKSARDGIG